MRILENDHSIAYQHAGQKFPNWTRFYESGDIPTTPAIGNDGTIFYLEPSMGRLRAVRPNGKDRWMYEFNQKTHSDLVLTSSPFGGLLITILRDGDEDDSIVAIRTDGHMQWKYDLSGGTLGNPTSRRLAVAPNGNVYYTMPDGGILALNIEGSPLWAYTQSGWFDSKEPVAGDDNSVFFISSGGTNITCMNSSGTERWSASMPTGWLAKYPSIDYNGDYFMVAGVDNSGTNNNRIFKFNKTNANILLTLTVGNARGNVVHDPEGHFLVVTETHWSDPPSIDDFFVGFNPNGTENWWLHTPGITKIGAYPVVDQLDNVYVQGPMGTYIVM